jgi:Tfp pilus assembly PilM family ATPase
MPKLIAIDQGSHAVKVAVYQTRGRGYELVGRFHQPVPQEGEAVSVEQRLAALDALLDENEDWAQASSVASWSGERATFRVVTLPFTDQAKIDQTLPFAVEGEVPFDMDNMLLASKVLSKDQQRTRMLTVLVEEEAIEEYIEQLNERQLDPARIVVDGDSAGAWGEEDRTVAVIDAGHAHTTITVVYDRQVQYCRTIDVAGAQFTKTIQRALGCDWAEAEAIKHGEEVASQQDPAVADASAGRMPAKAHEALDGVFGLFLASIRATLITAEDELGREIEEVRFTGGSSRLSILWDYLGQDLGVPIQRLTAANGDPVPGSFAVAEALARHIMGEAPGAIDLRVGRLAFKGSADAMRAALTYGLAGIGCFTVAAIALFILQTGQLNAELKTVDSALTDMVGEAFPEVSPALLSDPIQSLAVLRENTMMAVERADVLSQQDDEPFLVGTLLDLTEAMPPHGPVVLNVTDLTLSRKALSFQADLEAESGYAMAQEIETALQKHEKFSRVKRGEDQGGRTTRAFSWTIPLTDEVGEDG